MSNSFKANARVVACFCLALSSRALFADGNGVWTARPMSVASADFAKDGSIASAKLVFGSDNGLTNRLYLAWGAADGGTRIGGWEHTQLVCEVPGTMSEKTVEFPAGVRHARFFLDVPFPAGNSGEFLSFVKGDGTHYIDTGIVLKGGDDVRARVRPDTLDAGTLFGSRDGAVDNPNVMLMLSGEKKFLLDYCGSGKSGDYANYRLTSAVLSSGKWYDVVLSAAVRSVAEVGGASSSSTKDNADTFQTAASAYLFYASGFLTVNKKFAGSIASFSIRRGEAYVADYVPYRFGNQYGFFDRVSGTFKTAEGLTGEVDKTSPSPLTSVSGPLSGLLNPPEPRTVAVTGLDARTVTLAFGPDNGLVNRLYAAWGGADGGGTTNGWEHVECLGVVPGSADDWKAAVPPGAARLRFFLLADESVLDYVTGDGEHYIDTGVVLRGGDAVKVRFRPTKAETSTILGSRASQDANDRNVILGMTDKLFLLDYCGSGTEVLTYRQTVEGVSGWYLAGARWFDVVLSAEFRFAKFADDGTGPVNSNFCAHDFETVAPCRLFYGSGHYLSTSGVFSGQIASFSISRGGARLADYVPYRRGTKYGFFDRATGAFVTEEGLGGSPDRSLAFTEVVEPPEVSPGRSIAVAGRTSERVWLSFGPDNGLVNRLYAAWGEADGGASTNGWDHVAFLGEVTGATDAWDFAFPEGARCLRFFLVSPVGAGESALDYVTGDGAHFIDTGVVLKGGDAVKVRFRPTKIETCTILGSRAGTNTNPDDRNVILSLTDKQMTLDYCGTGGGTAYAAYRQTAVGVSGWYVNTWFDAELSADCRWIRVAASGIGPTNANFCAHDFETVAPCRLFYGSGNFLSNNGVFSGQIASFSVSRGAAVLADYVPYRRGTKYGFFDRATGAFVTAEGLTGSPDRAGVSDLTTASDVVTASQEPPTPYSGAVTVSNVTYDVNIGDFGKGDLYLPEAYSADTPMVLVIHGGSWSAESRASMRYVSEFFQQDLHMAAFNIDYRLAAPGSRWPACGDDCIKAARFLLSDEFRQQYGFGYRKVFLCGGSAGGHLALWTLVNMPTDTIAGCISVSSVGDPALDYKATPSHYINLFDSFEESKLELMNPCTRIASGMAPLLCTHATNDKVVPIAAHRAFADAYTKAGNVCRFYEYDSKDVLPDADPDSLNHFCMRSGGRFIYEIEDEIRQFVDGVMASERWGGRAIATVSVERDAAGVAVRAELGFGEGNGLTNALYRVWGFTDCGPTTNGWDQVEHLGDVTDEVNAWTAEIPSGAKFLRFVLSTPPTPGDCALCYVAGDGRHVLDTGMHLAGGDAVKIRFRALSGESSSVLGSRTDVDNDNVLLALDYDAIVLDYCGSGTAGDYSKYRLTKNGAWGWYANRWLEAELSPSMRALTDVATGIGWTNAVSCADSFETPANGLLFGASGNPRAANRFGGHIAAYSVVRDGRVLADWVPYRHGGVSGFFDRVTGSFRGAVGLAGEPVAGEGVHPMTSSDLIVTGASMRDILGAIDLPLLTIDTVGGEMPTCEPAEPPEGALGRGIRNATKVPGRLTLSVHGTIMYDSGDYDAEAGSGMTIKVRGHTSALASDKKPYKIKLMSKADLLCRGDDAKYEDKDWVLLMTAATLNNPVGFRVNELVGLPWTPGHQFVNVMMNGEYRGLYLLVESVDRNERCRVNVGESGFITEIDAYWWNEDGHYFKTPHCPALMGYTFKYPDADDLTPEQALSISNAIVKVEDSILDGTYPAHIDTGSWAAWLLGHDILGTADPAGSNQYLAKHDDGADTLVSRPTLWDFDSCFSSDIRDSSWAYVHVYGQGYFNLLWNSANRAFHTAYSLKWEQVRPRLETEIASLLDGMRTSGFARAFDLSRKLETGGDFKSFDSLALDIQDWFARRVVWLDGHLGQVLADPTLARMIRGMQNDPVWKARLQEASFVSRFGADLISAALMPSGKTDGSGRKLFNYDEYVAGTDPLRSDSRLRALISLENGKVQIQPDPELPGRIYTIWACEDLGDPWHADISSKDRFFKLSVNLKATGE